MATFLKILATGLAGAATLALGGCYDDGYGYGGVSVGAGSVYGGGYGYDPYYDGYGYGGYPAYGWFDGFYYPGNGYYVYDRGGRRFQMRDRDRQHWQGGGRNGQAGNWRGRNGVGVPGGQRPGDGRWNGRRDGRPDGQREGQWQGDRRGQGDPRLRNGGGVGATVDRQLRGGDRGQRWTERRQAMPQGQAGTPGAAPQRFERQRSFNPGSPRGGQFRQRGTGRNPQP
jgi:hypothetical protein